MAEGTNVSLDVTQKKNMTGNKVSKNSIKQTLTPSGKQKEAKSFLRIGSLFPGGYLKSNCTYTKRYQLQKKHIIL